MTQTEALSNPYVAGSPVSRPEMFFGRSDVFEFVRSALVGQHQDNIIVLYGKRRTGKTSVLYQMHRNLDPRYLPILVDLPVPDHGEPSGAVLGDRLHHSPVSAQRIPDRDTQAPA